MLFVNLDVGIRRTNDRMFEPSFDGNSSYLKLCNTMFVLVMWTTNLCIPQGHPLSCEERNLQ